MLSEICEPRIEEMLALVDQELIKSGLKNSIAAGVVLTGGTAMIEGIQELGEQIFNLPTRVGFPMRVGGLKDVVNSPHVRNGRGASDVRRGKRKEPTSDSASVPMKKIFNRILGRMRKWFVDVK